MADMRLGIVVDTDTRATRQEFSSLRREVKREAEALGDDWESAAGRVEDALREAGARDDLIEAARRIGQDGPTEIEKMRTALRDTGDDARTLSDDVNTAARGIRDSFEENALTPDDVFSADLKAELVSNMVETGSEVVRGFKDGFDSEDASTVVDGLTDTLASVGALSGPLGAAAALAGGAAIQSFAGPFIEGAEENAERFEETFSSAFDNIVSSGEEAGRELTIQNAVNDIVQDTERLNEVTQIANDLGVSRGQVLRAAAGDAEALRVVEEAGAETLRDATDARDDAVRAADGSVEASSALNDAESDLLQTDAKVSEGLRTLTGDYETNASAVSAASDAAKAKAEADEIATEKALVAAAATARQTGEAQDLEVTIDGVSESVRVMPNGKVIKVTDEGTSEETKQKIGRIKGKDVTVNVHANTSNVESYIRGLSYRRPVLNVDVRYRRVGGPTP